MAKPTVSSAKWSTISFVAAIVTIAVSVTTPPRPSSTLTVYS
jgi:hypothetical protein